jgi:hypothetical protein
MAGSPPHLGGADQAWLHGLDEPRWVAAQEVGVQVHQCEDRVAEGVQGEHGPGRHVQFSPIYRPVAAVRARYDACFCRAVPPREPARAGGSHGLTPHDLYRQGVERALCRLAHVRSLDRLGRRGPLDASAPGSSAFACLFGRDSLRIALDLLDDFPEVARHPA